MADKEKFYKDLKIINLYFYEPLLPNEEIEKTCRILKIPVSQTFLPIKK